MIMRMLNAVLRALRAVLDFINHALALILPAVWVVGLISLFLWMTFTSGSLYRLEKEHMAAKAAGVGYYDMTNGAFKYGTPPTVAEIPESATKCIPSNKFKCPVTDGGIHVN